MSKFLPAVVVADSLRELEVPVQTFMKDFEKVTTAGVERLVAFQNKDGGWGWFGADGSKTFMSAYVVYGLARAKRAGIAVDAQVIAKGVERLKKALPKEPDRNMRAYVLFALSTAGAPQNEQAKELAAAPSKLTSYAKALLALALKRGQAEDAARALLGALEQEKLEQGPDCHFETTSSFYKWENVSIETTAYALKAFVELDPQSPLVGKMAHWLIAQRQGGRWKSTKDTAAAVFGLIEYATRGGGDLALAAQSARRKNAPRKPRLLRTFVVTLNGKHERRVTLDANNPTDSKFRCRFEGGELSKGDNVIALTGDFDERVKTLGCDASLRFVEPRAQLSAERKGLGVSSTWSREPDGLRSGDEVEVTVSLQTEERYDYLLVTAPIPAGAEVVRDSASGVFAEFEVRHDRALFFVTRVEPGAHELHFRFRCLFPGRYTVLPPSSELMYNPAIRGSGESRVAVIGGN